MYSIDDNILEFNRVTKMNLSEFLYLLSYKMDKDKLKQTLTKHVNNT